MKSLSLFPGQGAKHLTLGYCVIRQVPQIMPNEKRVKTVIVGLPYGAEIQVHTEMLVRAEMPQAELDRIYEKYGYTQPE